MTKLAQDLVAKKCGILREEESIDKLTLQQYLDLYKQSLSEQSMEVVLKLTEVAAQKEKKRKKKQKTGNNHEKMALEEVDQQEMIKEDNLLHIKTKAGQKEIKGKKKKGKSQKRAP
jgi:hypothetical protein